jgi:hypothetical protein
VIWAWQRSKQLSPLPYIIAETERPETEPFCGCSVRCPQRMSSEHGTKNSAADSGRYSTNAFVY